MCDSPPGENDDNSIVSGGSTIYSTPVAQLGSTNDLANAATSPPPSNISQTQSSSNHMKDNKTSSSTNNSTNKNFINNARSSSNAPETQTGNKDTSEADMDPQRQLHNSCDAYQSPTSQKRSCLTGRQGGTVSEIFKFKLLLTTLNKDT